jgi:hypothetical protein
MTGHIGSWCYHITDLTENHPPRVVHLLGSYVGGRGLEAEAVRIAGKHNMTDYTIHRYRRRGNMVAADFQRWVDGHWEDED